MNTPPHHTQGQIRCRDVARWIASSPWIFVRWCARSRWRASIGVLLLFSLLAGGSVGAYGYWSSPTFCNSCHIMEPYHAAWQRSRHRDVACVQCHFEPGIENELHGKWVAIKQLAAVVTGAYSSMPYAEVSDASCLRSGCHSRQELGRPFEFSDRRIAFEHDKHLDQMPRGIHLACTSCHNQKLVTTHMEVDRSACFLCHFQGTETTAATDGKDIGDCKTCHGPPSDAREVAGVKVDHAAFEQRGMRCDQCHAEMVSGSGAVGLERCYSCHNEPEQIARAGDAGAMHVEHVTKHKMHCAQCHVFIEHGRNGGGAPDKIAAGEPGRAPATAADPAAAAAAPAPAPVSPAAPTPPSTGENERRPAGTAHAYAAVVAGGACTECHAGSHGAAELLYSGRGAQTLAGADTKAPRADPMHALGLDCTGCHAASAPPPVPPVPAAPGTAGQGGAPSPPHGADACKGCHADRYDAFVPAVAENLGAMVAHLDARVGAAQQKMAAARDQDGGVAREVYRAVSAAGNDVALVREGKPIHNPLYAIDVLRAADRKLAEAEAGLAIAPPDEQPLGFLTEDCTACHGALPMPGDLVLEGDRKYPHPPHVERTGLGCADCHQGEGHPVRAPTNEAVCKQCHNEEGK